MEELIGTIDTQTFGIAIIVMIVAGGLLARKWMRKQTESQIRAMKHLHVGTDGKPLESNVEAIHKASTGSVVESMSKSELEDTLALYKHAARMVDATGPDGELLEDVPDPEGLSRWFDEDAPRSGDVMDPAPVARTDEPHRDDVDEHESVVDAEAETIPADQPPKPPSDSNRGMRFRRKPAGMKTKLDEVADAD